MIKNGFKLTTEPIERWLTGCGCTDLKHYYFNQCDDKKKKIIDDLYHEYKRLNLTDNRCIEFFGIMEGQHFVLDRDKVKKKRKTLTQIYDEEEKRKERRRAAVQWKEK